MPIDYQKGKIYKIVDNTTDNIYIGSTCEPSLARRLSKHVGNYKSHLNGNSNFITSFEIIKNGDYNIILIEKFPCNTKDELYARERYWTNELICVNKYRNQGLLLELGLKQYTKDYYENNKQKLTEYNIMYRENHKEKLNDYCKEYYQENKDKISIQRTKKYNCICGGKYIHVNKNRHFLSKKHKEYEQQKIIPLDA